MLPSSLLNGTQGPRSSKRRPIYWVDGASKIVEFIGSVVDVCAGFPANLFCLLAFSFETFLLSGNCLGKKIIAFFFDRFFEPKTVLGSITKANHNGIHGLRL